MNSTVIDVKGTYTEKDIEYIFVSSIPNNETQSSELMELLKEKAPNVTIIGTTNISPKNNGLDGAAMSRFQNLIEVPFPDKDCLYEALKMNLDKIKNKEKKR